MASNYSAWNFGSNSFQNFSILSAADKCHLIARFGVLAPSSHNSQPWIIEPEDNKTIKVKPDFSRALPIADENNRQLTESLGCCVEYIALAAHALGVECSVDFDSNSLNASISLDFSGLGIADKRLFEALTARHTNRFDYLDKELPKDFLDWIQSLSGDNMFIKLVTDKKIVVELGKVAVSAEIEAMESEEFRNELSIYLKSNYTNSFFGIPAFGMGIPGIVSLFIPFLIKRKNLAKLNKAKDLKKFSYNTPVYLIIATDVDTRKEWFAVGRLFAKIAVIGAKQGIVTNPAAATIQIGQNYKKIQSILKINQRPQFFCRLGFAPKVMPHSPRKPLQ